MLFSFSYNPYIAIIGDIKKSKKITDRKSVQEKLRRVLEQVNKKYEKDISAKFMITLGDEFQGLLKGGENVLNIIQDIQMEMYPIIIRFGIGVGEITTNINAEMAIGADGPGYYMARSAIESLKQEELKNRKQSADIKIKIAEEKNKIAEMLNTIFSLMTVIQSNWTDRQREIIMDYRKYKGSQSDCAKRLGITQFSVQRGLNNGNYYAYKDAIDSVNDILGEIGK